MAYVLGACSLGLSLVLLGAACSDFSNSSGCTTIEDCPCNDGSIQPTNCANVVLCSQACVGHGGFTPPPVVDAGDGG